MLHRSQEIQINGFMLKLKYCSTCKLYRPPRTVHCGYCDSCVERLDHHCPWIGTCVGKRNYRYFFIFLTSISAYTIMVFITSIVHLVYLTEDNRNKGQNESIASRNALKTAWISLILIVYAFLFGIFVLGLTSYHYFLLSKNLTTNEHLKKYFRSRVFNPYFKKNFLFNFINVVCRRIPRSHFNRRGITDFKESEYNETHHMVTLANKSGHQSRRANFSSVLSNQTIRQTLSNVRHNNPQEHSNFSISQNHQLNNVQFQPGEIHNAEEETCTDSSIDNNGLPSLERREDIEVVQERREEINVIRNTIPVKIEIYESDESKESENITEEDVSGNNSDLGIEIQLDVDVSPQGSHKHHHHVHHGHNGHYKKKYEPVKIAMEFPPIDNSYRFVNKKYMNEESSPLTSFTPHGAFDSQQIQEHFGSDVDKNSKNHMFRKSTLKRKNDKLHNRSAATLHTGASLLNNGIPIEKASYRSSNASSKLRKQ